MEKKSGLDETRSYQDVQNHDDERTEGVTKYSNGQRRLLYARQCTELLMCINLFNLPAVLEGKCYYFAHFTNGEIEAVRSSVTCFLLSL